MSKKIKDYRKVMDKYHLELANKVRLEGALTKNVVMEYVKKPEVEPTKEEGK